MFVGIREGWKDIVERSVWTFLQVVLAVVVVVPAEEWTGDLFRSAALAGVAAVVSVIKNVAAHYEPVEDHTR